MPDVVSRAQAVEAGYGPRAIDELVRSGRWRALRRGTYLTGPSLPTDAAEHEAVRVRAAVLATGVPCVGSHESAALVHRLPLVVPYAGPPVLTRIRHPGGPRAAARRGAPLVAQVPPEHRVRVLGAEVTGPARTAVDLARVRSDLAGVAALDAVLRRGVRRTELLAVLDAQRGWPGVARARWRVRFADGRAESALESVGRLRFHQLGLPAPTLQAVLGDAGGPVGRVDFSWPDVRTVGEADGRGKYLTRHDLLAEKDREDRLRDAGFEVFRFGWHEAVHDPAVLGARALRAFARGRRGS